MNLKATRLLTVFPLAMIAVSAILSLRNVPMMATVGLPAIFFYLLAAITFLIPSALVCTELSTLFPNSGGVYSWVSFAFGKSTGFLAIWMEWLNNVIAFPASLATIVATLSYLGMPWLQEKVILFAVMMVILWGCTLYNLLGIKAASRLNVVGALLGTILPGALIIGLGLVWWLAGHPMAFQTAHASLLPQFHSGSLVFFISVLGAYSGMQVISFHAQNVSNPNKTFPRAILLATILIVILSICAALSMAAVLPAGKIQLVDGVIECFAQFFSVFHVSFFTPVLALFIAVGMIASLSAWILAPARGLQRATADGFLPKRLAGLNKADMPKSILFFQAIIATLLASVFLFMPSIRSAFWLLIALTSQFTLMMYILIFSSVIRLRYSHAHVTRTYKIPGGKIGVWIVGLLGMIVCAIGFVLGFIPPDALHIANESHFVMTVIGCDVVILGVPLLLLKIKK